MKITNKHGLPSTILNFARDDKYNKGNADISVTTLIDSPRIAILSRKHTEELESDVADMIWPLLGTAVHHMLESSSSDSNVTMEERLFVEVGGWTLSGQIDHQEVKDGRVFISDYKVTSVWSVIHGKEEWIKQLNCYAQMVRMAKGVEVGGIRIVAIMRDWQKREARLNADYPDAPVVTIQLPLWPEDRAMNYLSARIAEHQSAAAMWDTEEHKVQCSSDDMWEKPSTFAVMKTGMKRAKRVFPDYLSAADECRKLGSGHEVVTRPGGRTRCEEYCKVASFCTQHAMYKVEMAAPEFLGGDK